MEVKYQWEKIEREKRSRCPRSSAGSTENNKRI